MRATRLVVLTAVLTSSALSLPAFADKPGERDTTKTSGDTQSVSCSGGTVTFSGPTMLFPPNHKMVDEVGTATSTGTSIMPGSTSLTLNAATVDDVAGGDGNTETDSSAASTGTDSDMNRAATVPYQVRAERSGKGDGRTYTIQFTATFDDGSSCSSEMATASNAQKPPFTVSVPHDQGKGNNA